LESRLLDRVHNVVALQTHILAEERRHPEATGTFSWILSALSISAERIAAKIRRARLEDVPGALGTENVRGEAAQRGGRRGHGDPP
jgi:fructose-1,6-bisphosphatase I